MGWSPRDAYNPTVPKAIVHAYLSGLQYNDTDVAKLVGLSLKVR